MFTQLGFFSIVKKPDGFHIRARLREDLLNLGLIPAKSREDADYPWRAIIKDPAKWEAIMVKLADSVDYPNFKNKIAQKKDQKHRGHRYYAIWSLMAQENHQ